MGGKGHGGQENQAQPFAGFQMTGSESLNKIGNLCNETLKSQSDDKCGQHQPVVQMIHAKYGGFYIPHPYSMEEL